MKGKLEDTNRLDLIREAIANIDEFLGGIDTLETFENNKILCHAVVYNLQCVGEGVYKLSPEFITAHPEINWPEIDEDLCYEGFFKEKTRTDLYRLFMAHPELNASAVARRMGISQSLFAQYISGVKKPSQPRLSEIYATIHAIGEELVAIPAR